ncbi:RNA polymerase Rpb7 N-terminal domain-containing protein [Carex rostrata]
MFYLSQIEQNLPMPPHLLRPPLLDAIRGELEKLYLDKVIANLGLCISVYDIQSVEGGFIFPGDGCATYQVSCRLVMFRPFVGEVIVGKIESCDEFGLQVSLGFFNDIKIPTHLMMEPNHRGEDGIWVWVYSEGGEDSNFSLDIDEEIRFRVANVKFPPIPVEQSEDSKPFSPMEITGDINGDGLGLVSWW